ncbi:hypothetical protein niasHT_016153 [Heterodera trifolii]|uniref:guanylate cyclase n=1 Tax=Heterodera trifolii TaxID=157864 RepID=A0ABD2KVC6_9BILA
MDMVRMMLNQMVKDGNQNLMDYVYGMLEQYDSSLEQEVEERTKELMEEKRNSDILLYRMLPLQVADKLKLGEEENVRRAGDQITDHCLIRPMKPSDLGRIKVVNLLNALYTAFDGVIDTHDCYKVETISDGYLVCSGIPKRNGDQHAK